MSSNSPSFIGEYQISKSLCEEIIDFYRNQPFYSPPGSDFYSKQTGKVGNSINNAVKPEVKSSTDMGLGTNLIYQEIPSRAIPHRNILIKYLLELNPCVDEYLKEYPEWQFLSEEELNRVVIEIYDDLKIAKRFCSKEQKVIKVPNTDVFKIVSPHLIAKGITRIVSSDKLIAL